MIKYQLIDKNLRANMSTTKTETAKLVKQAYTSSPAAFSTPGRLREELVNRRKHGAEIHVPSLAKIEEEFKSIPTYTKFKKKYADDRTRDKAIISGPADLFQMDLAFMPKYGRHVGILMV